METSTDEQKVSFSLGLAGMWRHVRPFKKSLMLIGVLGLISSLTNGAIPYITGQFFDALITVSTETRTLWGLPLWLGLLSIWTSVQVTANGIDWIKDRLRRRLDNQVSFGVQARGFEHLYKLPLSFHTNVHPSGELQKLGQASWRISSTVRSVLELAPEFLSVLVGIVLAYSIEPVLALVLFVGVLVYVVMLIPLLIPIAKADHMAHKEWNDGWDDAAEAVHQIHSVKQAAAEDYQSKKVHDSLYGKVLELWFKLEKTWSNISFYQRIIVFLTQLSIFAISVSFITQGVITVGELIALNGYALMFFGPFVSLGYSWQVMQNGLTTAAQLEQTFRLEEEKYHPKNASVPMHRGGEITFRNVFFSYDSENLSVLKDVSFATSQGEVIALVGESGSGKSTTLSLVSGYYFPSEGKVFVDGLETREWDLIELRKRIAVVPQEVALFNDTIATNIKYGTFEATDAEVIEASRKAHIHDFIMELPKGYETIVGERGVKLSVGQKQRVAIARAILRDPEILILDEPTSALDAKTERIITESLEKLMRGRTTFIIAHRLSTVRKANRILVMEKGSIVEQGTHEELMEHKNGTYKRLYELHVGLE